MEPIPFVRLSEKEVEQAIAEFCEWIDGDGSLSEFQRKQMKAVYRAHMEKTHGVGRTVY